MGWYLKTLYTYFFTCAVVIHKTSNHAKLVELPFNPAQFKCSLSGVSTCGSVESCETSGETVLCLSASYWWLITVIWLSLLLTEVSKRSRWTEALACAGQTHPVIHPDKQTHIPPFTPLRWLLSHPESILVKINQSATGSCPASEWWTFTAFRKMQSTWLVPPHSTGCVGVLRSCSFFLGGGGLRRSSLTSTLMRAHIEG